MCAPWSGVFVALVVTLLISGRGYCRRQIDVRVTCVLKKSCVLPCDVQRVAGIKGGQPAQIYWNRIHPKFTPVYSHSYSEDPLSKNPYDGRAHLFSNQLFQGNASLLLTGVHILDRGTYRCSIKNGQKTIKISLIHVDVQAPVREVLLEEDGEKLRCKSKNIFPKPSVSWSPSSDHTPSVTSSVSKSGLFSVFSSVNLTQCPLEEHNCNVSTAHSWRSATYRRNAPVHISDSGATLLCNTSDFSLRNFRRVWKFSQEEIIVTQTAEQTVYSEAWRPFVAGVSESGDLTLKGLSKEHVGLFSCELSSDRETLSIHTPLEDTAPWRNVRNRRTPESLLKPPVVAAVVVAIVVVVAAGLTSGFCFYKRKKLLKTPSSTSDSASDRSTNGAPPENSELLGEVQAEAPGGSSA